MIPVAGPGIPNPNDHFGQNGLIPNWILAFARPKWTKMVHFGPFWPEEVHFGPFRSANRTLAIPETCNANQGDSRESLRRKTSIKAFSPQRGLVFAVKGASPPPLPHPQIPRRHSRPPPPALWRFSENPGGGGSSRKGGGGQGAPRPLLPRKRAPFSAKTPLFS